VRTTTAPYTESRLAHLVRNKCVGFPVVEHLVISCHEYLFRIASRISPCSQVFRSLDLDMKSIFIQDYLASYLDYFAHKT
jgi:hypothetical protein